MNKSVHSYYPMVGDLHSILKFALIKLLDLTYATHIVIWLVVLNVFADGGF